MTSVFMGIDIGTTHIKAMALTEEGTMKIATKNTPWEVVNQQLMMDPCELDKTVDAVVSASLDALSVQKVHVEAVGVTSFGEAGLYVQSHGDFRGKITAWQNVDLLSDLYERLISEFGASHLFEVTGISPSKKFGILRMKFQMPNLLEKPHGGLMWLSVADYVVWRLSGGVAVTHASLAARTMAYNIRKENWCEDILRWGGISFQQLPQIIHSVESVGEVKHCQDARLLGASIVHAGHDHISAAYGADIKEGEILDSSGTAEPLVIRTKNPVISSRGLTEGIMWGPGLWEGSYVALFPTQGGGAAELWVRGILHIDITEMGNSFIDCGKTAFHPESWTENNASLSGLGHNTSAESVYLAVLCGIAEHLNERLNKLESIIKLHSSELRLVGGIAYHDLWLRIRRQILNRPLLVMNPSEATLFGALKAAMDSVHGSSQFRRSWMSVTESKNEQVFN